MAASDVAISAKNVSKVYRLGSKDVAEDSLIKSFAKMIKSPVKNYKKYRSLYNFSDLDFDNPDANQNPNILWALRNVSFDVNKGEVVGIIGRNGAGKSTLLKILSRITPPATGSIEIHGRSASLLEVGTGFHPELTGRENVYLNGTILGMRKKEVESKFDEIVEFSGVEKFLDTPVKRYSSGMAVRLAFAVAAHLEPEILIIDEVLAVGDGAFQEKCLNKMQDVGSSGKTIFFVSHNMSAVTRLCSRVIMLENGCVIADGPAREIVNDYMHDGAQALAERTWPDPLRAPGNNIAWLKSVRIKDKDNQTTELIDIRSTVALEMTFEVIEGGHVLLPHFLLKNDEGVDVFMTIDVDPQWRRKKRPKGIYTSTAWVPGNYLSEGIQYITASMVALESFTFKVFSEEDAIRFKVFDPIEDDASRGDWKQKMPGLVRPLLEWETVFSEAGT